MGDGSHGFPSGRVLLVEGHKSLSGLLRETLAALPRLRVVAEVGTAREAVTAAEVHVPELIIMDLHLPDLCGLEAVSLLRDSHCTAKIILLIEQDDERYHQAAWLRGAAASVGKEHIGRELVTVVSQLLVDEPVDVSRSGEDATRGAS